MDCLKIHWTWLGSTSWVKWRLWMPPLCPKNFLWLNWKFMAIFSLRIQVCGGPGWWTTRAARSSAASFRPSTRSRKSCCSALVWPTWTTSRAARRRRRAAAFSAGASTLAPRRVIPRSWQASPTPVSAKWARARGSASPPWPPCRSVLFVRSPPRLFPLSFGLLVNWPFWRPYSSKKSSVMGIYQLIIVKKSIQSILVLLPLIDSEVFSMPVSQSKMHFQEYLTKWWIPSVFIARTDWALLLTWDDDV